jgi:hypothetical protein
VHFGATNKTSNFFEIIINLKKNLTAFLKILKKKYLKNIIIEKKFFFNFFNFFLKLAKLFCYNCGPPLKHKILKISHLII